MFLIMQSRWVHSDIRYFPPLLDLRGVRGYKHMEIARINQILKVLLLVIFFGVLSGEIYAETIVQDGLTLEWTSIAPGFSATIKQKMINTFFKVYPRLVKRFNIKSARTVNFVIDTSYNGVAETYGNTTKFGSVYMSKHAEDTDVVTHEVMHIVQAYEGGGVDWLTEGIADYVRHKYGINNVRGGWFLTAFTSSDKYTDSYRVTARFLVWAELHYGAALIERLDSESRKGTYKSNTWVCLTGKTVDQLWSEYSSNPLVPVEEASVRLTSGSGDNKKPYSRALH
jgi:hypothetical protein